MNSLVVAVVNDMEGAASLLNGPDIRLIGEDIKTLRAKAAILSLIDYVSIHVPEPLIDTFEDAAGDWKNGNVSSEEVIRLIFGRLRREIFPSREGY